MEWEWKRRAKRFTERGASNDESIRRSLYAYGYAILIHYTRKRMYLSIFNRCVPAGVTERLNIDIFNTFTSASIRPLRHFFVRTNIIGQI